MNRIEISRRQLALSRLHTIAVGTLTAIGEFAYSLIWGRQQARFIRKVLATSPPPPKCRIIASFSTLPERIGNLEPLLRSLLDQTCPPDEIVLAVPRFSIRQQREYAVLAISRRFRGYASSAAKPTGGQRRNSFQLSSRSSPRIAAIH